ncbi:MAG: 2,3,4,5-tetrahydropyridine-2,6-dicarboxylate N-succinyltransferase [Actinobacteria bacterium]|nr:2,3,4,5-tetrahydropyridine-2,6-dicarboxylate N-succinyltransferase [Actinomycetota bacterium]
MTEELRRTVREAFDAGGDAWDGLEVRDAVAQTMALLDRGELRVADPPADEDGEWTVNSWVREAILLYFRQAEMMRMEAGTFQYHDKIPVKTGHADNGVRVVPPGTARYGSFLEPGVVMMPSYVNIGAWVGSGTMVDTWATVGSCAQIGRDVHLSGGVGIGGVLEPPGADPVIVEDGAFIGSRCVVVEGARIGREAVLGALTVITASTPIIDVRSDEPSTARGVVPPRAVVVPGMRPRDFPAGTYHLPCALIIGERTASTDRKTSLNQALRDFQVQT